MGVRLGCRLFRGNSQSIPLFGAMVATKLVQSLDVEGGKCGGWGSSGSIGGRRSGVF